MPGWVRRGSLAGVVALLIVCAAWTAPEAARIRASVVVVTMEEPFAIHGTMYPGGRLTLRPISDPSPGMTLHAVALDGNMLGILPARHATSARERTEATALFGRDGKGRLHLLGYVSSERETYRF